MFKKYKAFDPEFVNTSESYSKCIFIGNKNVIIPYISAGLMPDNPINGKQSVVDYSYYLLADVQSMFFSAFRGKMSLEFDGNTDKSHITEHIMVGGYKTDNGAEVQIKCKETYFYLSDMAKINDSFHPFVPFDTPNFRQNINSTVADLFFTIDELPNEISEVLGNNICTLIWW